LEVAVSKKTNVELKAKARKLKALRTRLTRMGAQRIGLFHQIDTYFVVPRGRLKIREICHGKSQLVYYLRENRRRPKTSDVHIASLCDTKTMKTVLSDALGVQSVVRKRREIFMIEGVQVHLDRVDRLGSFIEFEKVVKRRASNIARAKEHLERLMSNLGVTEQDLQRFSYGELLLRGR
jgi:predicted adenylyl cyclase CyaB